MPADFQSVFAKLKPLLARHARRLSVTADTPVEYTLHTKSPSPFPQHKGHPLFFGSVKQGKAYVSYHLMPIYMVPGLMKAISPDLKKRMQGKACFNFKSEPAPEVLTELKRATQAALDAWAERKWL